MRTLGNTPQSQPFPPDLTARMTALEVAVTGLQAAVADLTMRVTALEGQIKLKKDK
jgi:cell division protein FtsB